MFKGSGLNAIAKSHKNYIFTQEKTPLPKTHLVTLWDFYSSKIWQPCKTFSQENSGNLARVLLKKNLSTLSDIYSRKIWQHCETFIQTISGNLLRLLFKKNLATVWDFIQERFGTLVRLWLKKNLATMKNFYPRKIWQPWRPVPDSELRSTRFKQAHNLTLKTKKFPCVNIDRSTSLFFLQKFLHVHSVSLPAFWSLFLIKHELRKRQYAWLNTESLYNWAKIINIHAWASLRCLKVMRNSIILYLKTISGPACVYLRAQSAQKMFL